MSQKDIFYSKAYFKYYCKKNNSFFNKINQIDDWNYIFDVSHSSLERYEIINSYLIDNNLLNKNLKLLDFWCYIWFYINFLQSIWIKNVYGIDSSYKSIKFWQKIWIKNLITWNITDLKKQISKDNIIDFISCIHVFEYMHILKNGNNFIYDTLKEWYRLLKKRGNILFNIWEWYKKFDKKLNKYINIKWKVNLPIEKILKIWFLNLKPIWKWYYILTK